MTTIVEFRNQKFPHGYYTTGLARKFNQLINKISDRCSFKSWDDKYINSFNMVKSASDKNKIHAQRFIRVLSWTRYSLHWVNIPAKAAHLFGVLGNTIAALHEFALSIILIPVSYLEKPLYTLFLGYKVCKQQETSPIAIELKNFVNKWNYSSAGHFGNALTYLGAAMFDLASVVLTPALTLDINNQYKQFVGITKAPQIQSFPQEFILE